MAQIMNIKEWLYIATEGLNAEDRDRIRAEIQAHYQAALAEALAVHHSQREAEAQALASLGNPKQAGKAIRQTSIKEWLRVATEGLCAEDRDRIRDEIQTHYQSALADALAHHSRHEAQAIALASLGNPKQAARAFRRTYFTANETAFLKDLDRPLEKNFIITWVVVAGAVIVANVLMAIVLPLTTPHPWCVTYLSPGKCILFGLGFFSLVMINVVLYSHLHNRILRNADPEKTRSALLRLYSIFVPLIVYGSLFFTGYLLYFKRSDTISILVAIFYPLWTLIYPAHRIISIGRKLNKRGAAS